MEETIHTREGEYDLAAFVRRVGHDVLVGIWGGERPHIGAVAVAQPRPSLRDPQRISATTSVFCRMGHKEDELAKAASEILASALNTTVVVTAGIHWDDLSPEGIQTVLKNCEILMDLILDRLASG
ncbi:MAG: hypothetical protein ACLFUL_06065 [Desulfobacteraceae bacterium]